jgi:hypothetical protein
MNRTDDLGGTPNQDYEGFRSELFQLAGAFDEAGALFRPLLHQWVWGDETMKSADWQAFIRANSRADGDWQNWSVVPGRLRCARFHGFQKGLDEYLRLAERGYSLLRRLRDCTKDRHDLPTGLVLDLPKKLGKDAWTEAIYLTARCYATALLSERSGYWASSGQGTGSEDDSWTTTEAGERYPDHPACEELIHDAFRSSAEAIRLWLDPEQVVTVGEVLDHPRLVFPSSQLALDSQHAEAPNAAVETYGPRFKARELWVGRFLVKKFNQPAENQEVVLASFQELNWPNRIDDPITPKYELVQKDRLRRTVEALNDYHKMTDLIRFESDGTGTGIRWRFGDRAHALLGISPPAG